MRRAGSRGRDSEARWLQRMVRRSVGFRKDAMKRCPNPECQLPCYGEELLCPKCGTDVESFGVSVCEASEKAVRALRLLATTYRTSEHESLARETDCIATALESRCSALQVMAENTQHSLGARTPNDLKLSDRRGWRGPCAVGERRRQEAGAVTAAPVRCSAWLGDLVLDGIVIAK